MHPWLALALLATHSAPTERRVQPVQTPSQTQSPMQTDGDPRRTRLDTTVSFKPDGTISLNVLNGTVRVTRWDRNEVQVRATTPTPAILDFDASSSAVDFKAYPKNITVTVFVPAKARLEVETVAATVTVEGLGGAVDIHTVSGNVDVTNSGKWLRIETVSGTVKVGQGAGDLAVNSISGAITCQDVSGIVNGESVSGAITVQGGRLARLTLGTVSGAMTFRSTPDPTGRYDMETHSGTVRIELPSSAKASVDVETTGGSVRNQHPGARRLPESDDDDDEATYRYVVNGVGARFRVTSDAGTVTLAKQ